MGAIASALANNLGAAAKTGGVQAASFFDLEDLDAAKGRGEEDAFNPSLSNTGAGKHVPRCGMAGSDTTVVDEGQDVQPYDQMQSDRSIGGGEEASSPYLSETGAAEHVPRGVMVDLEPPAVDKAYGVWPDGQMKSEKADGHCMQPNAARALSPSENMRLEGLPAIEPVAVTVNLSEASHNKLDRGWRFLGLCVAM